MLRNVVLGGGVGAHRGWFDFMVLFLVCFFFQAEDGIRDKGM